MGATDVMMSAQEGREDVEKMITDDWQQWQRQQKDDYWLTTTTKKTRTIRLLLIDQ